jgi:putative membrane protein
MFDLKTNVAVNDSVNLSTNKILDYFKWACVLSVAICTFLMRLNINSQLNNLTWIIFMMLFIFTFVHGTQRYGMKNMLIWFAITWVVSNGFEALSIKTGFPFGNYHYTSAGPRFLDVPLLIMIAYFGLAYMSWCVAQVVTTHFSKKFVGGYKFLIPFMTAFLMSMWDLVTDPQASTIGGTWIWEKGGAYYGVPISNFFGWLFVVFIFMQIFTLFMSNKNTDISPDNITSKKSYWLQPVLLYLTLGLGVVLEGFTHTKNVEIYSSMAMVAFFTMIFVAIISMLNIKHSKELN